MAEDRPKQESKTQLYVSNLPTGATGERLQAAFQKFGEITDAFIPHRGSRFGFVDFKDTDAASKALVEMSGVPLDAEALASFPEELIGVVRATVRTKPKPENAGESKAAPAAKAAAPGKKPAKDQASARDESGRAQRITKKMLDAVADKLFQSLSEQDWENAGACFAPSAQCFSPQRTGAKPQQFSEFKKTMGGMIGLLGRPEYLNVRRLYGNDSITEQHTTKFAARKETTVEAEACVLLRVNNDGLIVRMDEYLDPTVVLKAVQTASRK